MWEWSYCVKILLTNISIFSMDEFLMERESLNNLKKNKNISLVMSDKTNKICILDRNIAQQKEEDLTDNDSFELLNRDPSNKITASLNDICPYAPTSPLKVTSPFKCKGDF